MVYMQHTRWYYNNRIYIFSSSISMPKQYVSHISRCIKPRTKPPRTTIPQRDRNQNQNYCCWYQHQDSSISTRNDKWQRKKQLKEYSNKISMNKKNTHLREWVANAALFLLPAPTSLSAREGSTTPPEEERETYYLSQIIQLLLCTYCLLGNGSSLSCSSSTSTSSSNGTSVLFGEGLERTSH